MTAASVAVFSIFELRMMRAAAPDDYAVTLRWAHLPLFTLFVSIVGFVHLYFRSGKLWLGVAACGLRAVALVLNFSTGVNVNFEEVTAMQPVALWGGELVYVPIGVPNPFSIVAQLSNLLLIWFVADASVALWRGAIPIRGAAPPSWEAVSSFASSLPPSLRASSMAV